MAGFGGAGGMNPQAMLKAVQKLQNVQEDLGNQRVEGTSGGGMVTATVNGTLRLVSLSINAEVVDPDDVEMLEDLVVSAINEAQSKAEDAAKQQYMSITGGLKLPEFCEANGMYYARPLGRLVGELEKLPGVGPKTAQRLAFHILSLPAEEGRLLADAIIEVKEKIRFCDGCHNFTDQPLCEICRDPRRTEDIICVVAEPRDVIAMEKTNEFRGRYHVLQGVISPMDGITADDLTVAHLLKRIAAHRPQEIILATNPTVEGETTSMYLTGILKPLVPRVTRIAHGLPVGGDLDYADQATLIKALEWRREV